MGLHKASTEEQQRKIEGNRHARELDNSYRLISDSSKRDLKKHYQFITRAFKFKTRI